MCHSLKTVRKVPGRFVGWQTPEVPIRTPRLAPYRIIQEKYDTKRKSNSGIFWNYLTISYCIVLNDSVR